MARKEKAARKPNAVHSHSSSIALNESRSSLFGQILLANLIIASLLALPLRPAPGKVAEDCPSPRRGRALRLLAASSSSLYARPNGRLGFP